MFLYSKIRVKSVEEKTQTIKKLIFELRKDFGNVMAVDEVVRMGITENIAKDDIIKVIKNLEEEGMVRFLDDDTIEVNA